MYEDEIPIGKANDLTGKVFGKLTVLYRVANIGSATAWNCHNHCSGFCTVCDLQYHSQSH